MRTTLTLDDDVAALLREEAHRSKRPFKQVVNQAIRLGLRASGAAERKRFEVRPHAFGFRPGVDVDKLNQLVDQLEVESFAEKYRRELRRP